LFTDRKLDLIIGRGFAALLALLTTGMLCATLAPTLSLFTFLDDGNALGKVAVEGLGSVLPGSAGRFIIGLVMLIVTLGALHLAMALTIGEWHGLFAFISETAQSAVQAILDGVGALVDHVRRRTQGDEDEASESDDDENDSADESDDDETPPSLFQRLFKRPSAKHSDETPPDDDEDNEEDADDEDNSDDEEDAPPAPKAGVKGSKVKLVQRAPPVSRQTRLPFRDDDHETPPLDLLQWPDAAKQTRPELTKDALEKNAKLLESVLADFGVYGQITKVSPGPVVTLYELEPSPGTRASRVISLADDIARNMSATAVRVAVVPGRNVIGIELPNKKREVVYLRELLSSGCYTDHAGSLPIVLGKDIAGMPVIADLARMPHLLIAGTTGSGKSVAINTMILSLLYRLPPQKCRFIMVDPKMLELSVYEGIPHLLAPVVTEPKKAIVALKWTVREMEERYRAMSKLGVRNIEGYNIRLQEAAKNNENLTRKVQTGYDKDTGKPIFEEQPLDLTPLPYIVVIVDEMADLMIVAGKEIEGAVQRLAQMARAAGIHILMATQRPSVDVITGTIKANFPTRISFQVTSKIDSRTILGEQGAEQLLGQGDMLYMAGGGRVTRVHGPFVRDDEVESVVKFLKAQGEPEYLDEVTEESDIDIGGDGGEGSGGNGSAEDELYDKAVAIVLRERKASTSFIQRHLSIGYNKAATLIERMEREKVISAANHVGKREVYGRKPTEDDDDEE
jgi:S-DNA-T family DNA segregation ATPase FtsK/SpoIIIE